MKFNKKVMALNLLMSLLISHSAYAKLEGIRSDRTTSPGSGKPSTGKVETRSSTSTSEEGTVFTPVVEAECNADMDQEKYFPQELFRHLTRDGDDITIEKRDNNKIIVKVPPILNVCGTFIPELRQNKDSKDVTILMKLISKKDGVEKEMTNKDLENCLASEKITSKVNGADVETPMSVDGKINHDIIPNTKYSERTYSMNFDFDSKKDYAKSVKLSFAAPRSTYNPRNGYSALHAFDPKASVAGMGCMQVETIASKEPLYINEGRDILLRKINEACGKGGKAILDAKASLGNAEALKDIAEKLKAELDAAYLIAVKDEVKKIYKDMGDIEDRLIRNFSEIKEKDAKVLVEKYAELAKKLDSDFLGKAIERLDILMQKREKLEEGSEAMKALDKEIKQLNIEIGEFSKRPASSLDTLYKVMEKFALTDSAETIEAILVKSGTYRKVYGEEEDSTRDKPLTILAAQEEHALKIKNFSRVMVDWRDVYSAGKGNAAIVERTMKEYDNWTNRMSKKWVSFNQKEQEDLVKYCSIGWTGSVANPVKCNQHRSGAAKRQAKVIKQLGQDDKKRKRLEGKFNKMNKSLTEYEMKMAESRKDTDDSDFSGSSYSGFEDTFEDRFPGYYGPRVSSAPMGYDPSMYNMGGNPAMMGQGIQQMGGGMQRFPAQAGGMGNWPAVP